MNETYEKEYVMMIEVRTDGWISSFGSDITSNRLDI